VFGIRGAQGGSAYATLFLLILLLFLSYPNTFFLRAAHFRTVLFSSAQRSSGPREGAIMASYYPFYPVYLGSFEHFYCRSPRGQLRIVAEQDELMIGNEAVPASANCGETFGIAVDERVIEYERQV
jgi:hypothetical protein